MPKRVDVHERRRRVIDAVLRVIHERGSEAVTVRTVAEEAEMSHGLVHHYFPEGKVEMVHAAVTTAVDDGMQRMAVALETRVGLEAVRAVAAELLPLTPARRVEWSAWVALWGSTLADPALRGEQADRLDAWRELLGVLLQQAVDDGSLPSRLDVAATALRLAAFLDGLGLHALVQPELLPASALAEQVDAFLATLAAVQVAA